MGDARPSGGAPPVPGADLDELLAQLQRVNRDTAAIREAFVEGVNRHQDRRAVLANTFAGALGLIVPEPGVEPAPSLGGLTPAGARSVLAVLAVHPGFADAERAGPALALVPPTESSELVAAEARDSLALLATGAVASGLANAPLEVLHGLARVALGADDLSHVIRRAIVGGKRPLPDLDPLHKFDLRHLQELVSRTCVVGVMHALGEVGRAAAGAATSSDATGISAVVPSSCCPGDLVEVRGSGFGTGQPAGVDLYVPRRTGCGPVSPQSWTDTSIRFVAPSTIAAGCVGFVRATGGGGGNLASASAQLAGEMLSCFGAVAQAAATRLQNMPTALISCPPCLPGGANALTAAGLPLINTFEVNGASSPTVPPGTPLTLGWSVFGASSVSLARVGTAGPPVPAGLRPPVGTLALGPFAATQKVTATYRLEASSACGSLQRTVTVTADARPKLNIGRVVLVQAIQTPADDVVLVAGKRTAVRVFVSSGLPATWNAGGGPGVQPGVTGEIVLTGGSPLQTVTLTQPLNPGGAIGAPAAVNEDRLGHSLLFEVPIELTQGTLSVSARVRVAGPAGTGLSAPTVVAGSFSPQPRQNILPILLADPITLGQPPSRQAFRNTVAGALPRCPVAEDGFVLKPPIETSLSPGIDLRGDFGWGWLIFNLSTWVFLFPTQDVDGLRTAMVPADSNYANNGIGTPRVGAAVPAVALQVGLPATLAHEWGHAYGLGHAPCPAAGEEGEPDGIDSRLGPRTRWAGMNVPSRAVVPSGTGEIMSYCGGQSRWPSEDYWEFVRVRVPI